MVHTKPAMRFPAKVTVIAVTLLTTLAVAVYAASAVAQRPPQDAFDEEYKSVLPRIPPKEPAEALKSFQLRPGFRIELVAAEPLIRSPVAMEFDENGRMFVVEYPEYNQYANPNKDTVGHGCVRMLEDTDGDGVFDKSTVYVDDLDSPTAVACYDGGVFVGCVPDILFCKDTDGEGKADLRKAVFTGFARDPAGEAMLNSFRWGLENRFHVSTSLSGGNVRRADQTDAKPASVRGQGFLFDPRTLSFELLSGGGQHGMSMDDWGHTFVCGNSEPVHMLMYDGRYIARNPYVEAAAAAINIAPDGKFTQLFRLSPIEPWRALRTRLRAQGTVKGSDEGGKPSGFFTGATGVTVYRGDAWPQEYRGNVFVGEVANNLVYRAKLEPAGVGFAAKRADAGVEFLASSDIWFRPAQFANAPDGTLYVIDMCRELIEGAAFLPPEILKHMDVSSGVDRGRIYRIVPNDFKQPKRPQLGKSSTAELVQLLEHRNGWHRDTAARLLYQRQDRRAIGPLKKLASESESPEGRTHALYALAGLAALEPSDVLRALDDADPRVREQALRLSERFADSLALRSRLEKLADDTEIRVRYQLAFSIGTVRGEFRNRVIAKLADRDGGDPWFRLALLSSLNEGAGEAFRLLGSDNAFRATAHGRSLLATLATQIGASNRKDEIAAVLQSLDALPDGETSLADAIVRGLVAKQQPAAKKLLTEAAGGKAAEVLADLLREARETAPNEQREVADRAEAIRTLGLAGFGGLAPLFAELLKLRQPQPVQAAAIETLAKFDHPAVAPILLAAWPSLSPQLRARATETMFSRPIWIAAFLDAVEQGKVGRGDVDPARIKLLESHPDKMVRSRIATLFSQVAIAGRQEVVAAYQSALKLEGDAARGKVVFKTACSACHKLDGVGESVGAELMAIRDQGSAAIMLNILDPNRDVKPQFLTYVLATDDGRVLTGMITEETANNITIRRPDGTSETVARLHIEELRCSGQSFMPEGIEKQIDLKAMADLLAYLNSIK